MMQHVLCVSYDDRLLLARRTLLEQNGYNVTPALGFTESMARCEAGGFDLLILGHSIPHSDKERLMQGFRRGNSAPILALWRADERVLDTANYLTFSDDAATLLKAIGVILAKEPSILDHF